MRLSLCSIFNAVWTHSESHGGFWHSNTLDFSTSLTHTRVLFLSTNFVILYILGFPNTHIRENFLLFWVNTYNVHKSFLLHTEKVFVFSIFDNVFMFWWVLQMSLNLTYFVLFFVIIFFYYGNSDQISIVNYFYKLLKFLKASIIQAKHINRLLSISAYCGFLDSCYFDDLKAK